MQYTAVVLASLAAAVAAQSCPSDYSSNFGISVVKTPGEKRDLLSKRAACDAGGDKSLTINLKGGILKDQNNRIGYIASNAQFQFDAPPQPGHLETSGFQVCGNNSLALNGNAVWYQCKSGNFYNLYNKDTGLAGCSPVEIMAVPCTGSAPPNPAINGGATAGGMSAGASATAAPSTSAASTAAASTSVAASAAPAPTIATGAAAQYGPQIILAAAGFAGVALL